MEFQKFKANKTPLGDKEAAVTGIFVVFELLIDKKGSSTL